MTAARHQPRIADRFEFARWNFPAVCHGAKAGICIRLSLVVTTRRNENAATWWKRTTGQGSARQ